MKRMLLVAVITATLAATSTMAGTAEPAVDSHDVAGVIMSFGPIESHDQRYRAEVVGYSMLGARVGRWIVHVESAGGREVSNAQLQVSVTMPDRPEVPARAALARSVGGGRYEITGLRFDRSGWWNVGLVIRDRGASDSLAFNLVLR